MLNYGYYITGGIRMDEIAKLLKPLQRKVFYSLIKDFNYTLDEAIKSIALHNKVFVILENEIGFIDPQVISTKIHQNYCNERSPEYWIEWLSLFSDIRTMLTENMKMTEPKKREQEFCKKCNYPKYKDEDCRFCKV